ncbi:hypothetical protein OE88DRAFT_1652978 [Heliocybe sulcata]|uniref:Protein kinase domain-containing protein n=1 Tax=Heliocybe sulcata TaxID=5364 RepID=A0A5C3NBB4_9AGAM|nr:hypothetical protein OE88DRAFT_1652978 [Heliocybe sulcata]
MSIGEIMQRSPEPPGTPPPRPIPSDSSAIKETPHGISSDANDHLCVDDLQGALDIELHGTWVNGGQGMVDSFIDSAKVPDMPSDDNVDAFLVSYDGYVDGRWKDVPKDATVEDETLYEPIRRHINAILREYGRITRSAVATHATTMGHMNNMYETKLKTKPDISLMGYGSSVSGVEGIPSPPEYTHCIAPIEVKREKTKSLVNDRIQLAVYARECIIQQPSRNLVYSTVLTEKNIRLHQYDRCGGMFSCETDIHANARTFVKIVLALSTVHEKLLGFETRIYWDGPVRYFKPDLAKPDAYVIDNPDKPFRRHTIRGRGTTCWILNGYDGNKLLLKLAWRTIERDAEWTFLDTILGENKKRAEQGRAPIPGIGSILEYGDLEKLSDFRHGIPMVVPDRIYYWILQPYYGPALDQAPSVLQSLNALCDIIQGQAELHELGIVHRDISVLNMAVSPSLETAEGQRGHLIDFDMAKRVDREQSMAGKDLRTGTRVFQSIKVLEGLGSHDYLDDLESTFWAYTWIACTSVKPAEPMDGIPTQLVGWGSSTLDRAIKSKEDFLKNKRCYYLVSPGMGPHVKNLISYMARFFHSTALPRLERLREERDDGLSHDDKPLDYATRALIEQGLIDPPHNTGDSRPAVADARKHFGGILWAVRDAIKNEKVDLERKAAGAFVPVPDKDYETPVLVTKIPGVMNQQQPVRQTKASRMKPSRKTLEERERARRDEENVTYELEMGSSSGSNKRVRRQVGEPKPQKKSKGK